MMDKDARNDIQKSAKSLSAMIVGQGKSDSFLLGNVTRTGEYGRVWVMLDGAESEVPCIPEVTALRGDRVTVRITPDGRAFMTGNQSDPGVNGKVVDMATSGLTLQIDTLRADLVQTNEVVAQKVDTSELEAESARIDDLEADNVDITGRLTASEGRITDLQAETAKIQNVTAQQIEAATGYIGDLQTANVTAQNIAADHATVGSLSTTYARIDAANITDVTAQNAWVDKVLVQTGLIANSGTVFTLDAIQVNAANITAGTLDVERLIVTVDGEKYMVHVNAQGTPSYEKLDGGIIGDHTIAADKLVAHSITASEITTQNLVGTGGWINLANGTFGYYQGATFDTSPSGLSWDGNNLRIKATSLVFEGGMDVEQAISNTLIYDHTYEYDAGHTQVTFTAHLYRAGVDVRDEYPAEQFTWYKKNEDSSTEEYLGSGYTITVVLAAMGYGSHIIGKFTTTEDSDLLTSGDDSLQDSGGNQMTVRTESGESVRVSDLEVSTTLYPTDKLMVSGAEDEHLVTVATLQAYLESSMTKQVRFGTTAQWDAQPSLVSEQGTVYIYTDHAADQYGNVLAGVKVGDGNAYLIDLPFTDALLTAHLADTTAHVTAAERAFWNEKVRAYYAGVEQLVLTTS